MKRRLSDVHLGIHHNNNNNNNNNSNVDDEDVINITPHQQVVDQQHHHHRTSSSGHTAVPLLSSMTSSTSTSISTTSTTTMKTSSSSSTRRTNTTSGTITTSPHIILSSTPSSSHRHHQQQQQQQQQQYPLIKRFKSNNDLPTLMEEVHTQTIATTSIITLKDLNCSLLNHILLYIPDQRHVLFTCSQICKKFALCILEKQSETTTTTTTNHGLWSSGERSFCYGWYGTRQLRTPVDQLILFHGMSRIDLCDVSLSHSTLLNLMQHGKCVRSLTLFRVKLMSTTASSSLSNHPPFSNQVIINRNNDIDVDKNSSNEVELNDNRMQLESLTIDCCNDLPTSVVDDLIVKCCSVERLKELQFKDSTCITNDTIDSLILLLSSNNNNNNNNSTNNQSTVLGVNNVELIHLKNLSYVTHEALCCLLRLCKQLKQLSIEGCHWISEWKLMECLIDEGLTNSLQRLQLIGFDYHRRQLALLSSSSSSSSSVVNSDGDAQQLNQPQTMPSSSILSEHNQIMQQMVQQAVTTDKNTPVSVFCRLKHLILHNCNDQFTNIALNRIVHGMTKGQLHTLKLSTNASTVQGTVSATGNRVNGGNVTADSSAAGSSSQKPFLIQKEKYYGLLGLKELDIHMSSLHPSFVTNLLHACCAHVTHLSMSYGTFFNKGLTLFTTVAKSVKRLSLSDCSFENSDWFNIISYNLPNLRQLSVCRVHVKSQKQQDTTRPQRASLAPPSQTQEKHHSVSSAPLAYRPQVTNIQKLWFDSLYSLVGIDESLSTSINDVSEIGRLILYSPTLDLLDFRNIGKWEIICWLSRCLGHVEKHNGLTLKITFKSPVGQDMMQDMVFIPKLYMFAPSIHTLDIQIESNGFNSHLLLALCCQNVQHKVNIVLSDQCEKELIAISEYYYSNDNFTYYPTVRQRMEDIIIKQTKERISDLITQGVLGLDDAQKQSLIQKYMRMNSYKEFVSCKHLALLLESCVEFLIDHEKHSEQNNDDNEYNMSGSIFTYDEVDGADQNDEADRSSCNIM